MEPNDRTAILVAIAIIIGWLIVKRRETAQANDKPWHLLYGGLSGEGAVGRCG